MFRIVSIDYCVKPLYSRLLCEAIRAVCSGSCQSYTADYCVKPLGCMFRIVSVIYSRLLCEAIRAVCSGSCVIYSRLLCEAIRAVCSGSCQSYTADYCVKPLGLYVSHIQPTIV